MEGGINLYQFALGDPINFSDPLGLKVCFRGTNREIRLLIAATQNATDTDLELDGKSCVSNVRSRGSAAFDDVRMGFVRLVESDYTFGIGFSREFSHANGREARIYERYNALAYPAIVDGQCLREQVPWVLTQVIAHELAHLYPAADGVSIMAGEDAAVAAENVFNRARGKPERCAY